MSYGRHEHRRGADCSTLCAAQDNHPGSVDATRAICGGHWRNSVYKRKGDLSTCQDIPLSKLTLYDPGI